MFEIRTKPLNMMYFLMNDQRWVIKDENTVIIEGRIIVFLRFDLRHNIIKYNPFMTMKTPTL